MSGTWRACTGSRSCEPHIEVPQYRQKLQGLFPFSESEIEFFRTISHQSIILPELVSSVPECSKTFRTIICRHDKHWMSGIAWHSGNDLLLEEDLCLDTQIKTTGSAGGMHHAFKAFVPAARYGL